VTVRPARACDFLFAYLKLDCLYEAEGLISQLPFMCQRSAEIWAAEHVEIKAGEYPKIRCSRHEFGSRVG